jgi:hypothetical protein
MLFSLLTMTSNVDLIQFSPAAVIEIGSNLHWQFDAANHGLVLAEQFQSTDLLGNIQTGWDDFLKTGKAGVLAVGLVMGYALRSMTAN